MRFLLDENVQASVGRLLTAQGHDSVFAYEILEPGSLDQVVATTAQQDNRILVSHDSDMRRIEKKISDKFRQRYPALSRLMLCLPEQLAAQRLQKFLPVVELEYNQSQNANEAMMFEICERRVRLHR
jgi:predicted nuclease of predicted toxin-antitoxin system